MIQTGLAIASGRDTADVARLVVDRALSQLSTPTFAVLFSSLSYDQKILFDTIRARLGPIPIFGTTSSILISSRGSEPDSVLLLLLQAPDLEFSILSGKCGRNPAEIGSYLASRYLFDAKPTAGDLVSCILTGTEKHHSSFSYLHGLYSVFPWRLPVTGGTTVGRFPSEVYDDIFIGNQYCGNLLTQDHLALLFLRARMRRKRLMRSKPGSSRATWASRNTRS
ncbi:MAG TPA: FIST N-terminal domain-containing protein, partial [Candidatus Ozemobacteraceae bacterium]|nr:FIST N-terminal domain-containing protein [Candidatus Ozemobacteraceae bacterium]